MTAKEVGERLANVLTHGVFRHLKSRPPPGSPPGEHLRWVRGLATAMILLAVFIWGFAWATADVPLWIALAGVGLAITSPVGLTFSIRAAEKKAAEPGYRPPSAEEQRRRGRRAQAIVVPVMVIALAVTGHVLLGIGGAAFFLVMGLVGSALGIAIERRYWKP